MIISSPYTLLNDNFRRFLFYGGFAILKTLAMSPITSYYSKTRKVFRNEEDAKWYYGGNNKDKIRKSLEKNEEVERVGFLLDYN